MVQTFSDNKYIYSVDMMFAFLYFNKIKPIKQIINDSILVNLDYDCWGDPVKNEKYSPNQVILNPKMYSNEYKKIIDSDLQYPIIINEQGNIIDGMHRLMKSVLFNKKYIRAYVFDNKLMKKFIIAKNNEWNKVDNLKTYQFIILYAQQFLK